MARHGLGYCCEDDRTGSKIVIYFTYRFGFPPFIPSVANWWKRYLKHAQNSPVWEYKTHGQQREFDYDGDGNVIGTQYDAGYDSHVNRYTGNISNDNIREWPQNFLAPLDLGWPLDPGQEHVFLPGMQAAENTMQELRTIYWSEPQWYTYVNQSVYIYGQITERSVEHTDEMLLEELDLLKTQMPMNSFQGSTDRFLVPTFSITFLNDSGEAGSQFLPELEINPGGMVVAGRWMEHQRYSTQRAHETRYPAFEIKSEIEIHGNYRMTTADWNAIPSSGFNFPLYSANGVVDFIQPAGNYQATCIYQENGKPWFQR